MKTLCIVKPHAMNDCGNILQEFLDHSFKVIEIKTINKNLDTWKDFYKEHENEDFFKKITSKMANKNLLLFVIDGVDVIKKVREFIGNTSVILADENTIRYMYGDLYGDSADNAIHSSDSITSFKREYELLK